MFGQTFTKVLQFFATKGEMFLKPKVGHLVNTIFFYPNCHIKYHELNIAQITPLNRKPKAHVHAPEYMLECPLKLSSDEMPFFFSFLLACRF